MNTILLTENPMFLTTFYPFQTSINPSQRPEPEPRNYMIIFTYGNLT